MFDGFVKGLFLEIISQEEIDLETYKGFWFLPGFEKDENCRGGTLTVNDDGEASLEILGLFPHYHYSRFGVVIADDSTTAILGVAGGKKITLIKCFPRQLSLDYDAPQSFSVGYVLIGEHFKEEALLFKRMRFRATNLNEWVVPRNMHLGVNHQEKKVSLEYELPADVCVPIGNGIQLTLTANTNNLAYKIPFYEMTIREDHFFELLAKDCLPFDQLMHMQFILLRFLELAIGSVQLPSDIAVFIDEQEIQVICHLSEKKTKDYVHPGFMLINYPQTKDMWGKIISKWYETYGKMDDVYNLYFSICQRKSGFAEQSFLSFAQFLESYHRKTHPVTQVEKDAWKVIRKRIVDAVSKEDKDCVARALQYGHEPSFKKRLEYLLDNCMVTKHILKEREQKDYIDTIVATRNYFTHYTNGKNVIHDTMQLMDIAETMNRFAQYYLLISAGLSHDEVELLFKQKYHWDQPDFPEFSPETNEQE